MVHDDVKLVLQASPVSYNTLKDLILYLRDRARYIKRLEENIEKLGTAIMTMKSRKAQTILEEQIKVFRLKYDKFLDKYEKYRGRDVSIPVRDLDASSLSIDIHALQQRKTTMWRFKFWALAKLSKRIAELHDYVFQLIGRLNQQNLVMEKKPEVVQETQNVGDNLPHLNGYVDEILSHLKNASENRLIFGIVGPVGRGKTTILAKLVNELDALLHSSDENNNLRFDYIIRINFPQGLDSEEKMVEAIQVKIMKRLKIEDEVKNIEQNRYHISRMLSGKKYLLLVDQVNIDLDKVGIHKEHKYGKVVVASISSTCVREMEIKSQVIIQRLSDEDAWKVLESVCGTIRDERVRYVGNQIIKCCGGELLAIKKVAVILKVDINEQYWRAVKRNLDSDPLPELLGLGPIGKAYEMLYNQLKGVHFKKCSLYGAFFPVRHKIYKNYLMECWKAEGFFDNVQNIQILREVREEGKFVFNELIARNLLDAFDKYVQMPVFFRKVALALDYPGEENSKKWKAEELRELSKKEIWGAIRRMSLIGQISPETPGEGTSASAESRRDLHASPTCNGITTLLLQFNPNLENLGINFFFHMESLKLLDLHETGIKLLPTSISYLKNLVSLYLNKCCKLSLLPLEVAELSELEILDIRNTPIHPWLPQQIKKMESLRCFRVSFDDKRLIPVKAGETTPGDIFSNLKLLEELIIETDTRSIRWKEVADEMGSVLVHLQKLTTLHFNFPSVESLVKFIDDSSSWKNEMTEWGLNTFRSFRFFVDCNEVRHQYVSDICGNLAERHCRISLPNKDIP